MTIHQAEPSDRTKRIARALAEAMPHLEFAFWDLSEFIPAFHNVRRNMVFIECEGLARKEAVGILAAKAGNSIVYSGERKPKSINEEWAAAKGNEIRDAIVVVSRKDFSETLPFEGKMRIPTLERQLVDLLSYSMRGYLPIALEEAIDAFISFQKGGRLKISGMQRYATRRYLGWFFDVLLYKLAKTGRIEEYSIDPRYLENGRKYHEAIKKVDLLEY